jgi:hypothetical protein
MRYRQLLRIHKLYDIDGRQSKEANVAGDSHTNFDSAAFTVGTLGGAATIAGAIGAGIANVRAQRQSEFADWQEVELRAALELSEAFRGNDRRVIMAQRVTIARLERLEATRRARTRLRN